MTVPGPTLAAAAAGLLVAAVLAALWPAHVATRGGPLDAVWQGRS